MADRDTFWKVLDGTRPVHGGTGRYPGKGRWTKRIDGDLVACERGYHLARGPQLLDWLPRRDVFAVWTAEPGAQLVEADGKWVTDRVRLVERFDVDARMLRLFAADCAEAALLGERACGREPDGRSWAAVDVARRWAVGDATDNERAAAWDAAWTHAYVAWAAGAAARDAARDAAGAHAYVARAARAAARAAASAAAGAHTYVAGAARAAARDAARDAMWAAWDAAGAAADAARNALYDRFVAHLTGDLPPVTALYGDTANG